VARNLGAVAARGEWLAYIDDDAVPDPGWVAAIAEAAAKLPTAAALGGKILPRFEAPLPGWWPPRLVGVLTVLTHDRPGIVGRNLPRGVEPYGANFIVRRDALAAIGGFPEGLGRVGARLLSNEESLVLRRLAAAGGAIAYDPAIAVTHSIQAERLNPAWLLRRQFWQGVSAARLRRLLGEGRALWAEAPRHLATGLLLGPLLLLPARSARLIGLRARAAYAWGCLRGLATGG
jgi:GT2 family glycosyltransferase